MNKEAWTVYWAYGMTEFYAVPPNGSPKNSEDHLIVTINPDAHENGYDENNAIFIAKALSKHWVGEW